MLSCARLEGIPVSVPLPACLGEAKSVRAIRQWRMKGYLNRVLEYFPERLAETKWMSRCHIVGLDRVLRARQNGRPVVLAFFHFGAYRMSRFWLQAAGVPVATLLAGKAEDRAKWKRLEVERLKTASFPRFRPPSIWMNYAKRTSFSPPGMHY